jgi:hypothetical protein
MLSASDVGWKSRDGGSAKSVLQGKNFLSEVSGFVFLEDGLMSLIS